MNINISEDAKSYIRDKGGIAAVEVKVAGGWVRIEEPVVFLNKPRDIENYNAHDIGDIKVFVKKGINEPSISISLRKFLFIKTLVVEGLKLNKL